MDDPLSMRWVDIMLHYKTFPRIYHNILSWVDTQYASVYTQIFYQNNFIYSFELFY